MPVIYIDVLLAVNLLINFLLLKSCCVFTALKQTNIRIFLGAFIGACYAVLIFFPDFTVLYTTISKLLISMLIVAAAFPFYTIKSYIKTLIIFYIVSFGFGGCVLAVFYFSDIGQKMGAVYSNGIFYFNLPWVVLVLSGSLYYIAVKLFGYFSGRMHCSKTLKKKLVIKYNDNTAFITALLDTGNSLIDPVSLSPVIIAEYKSIKNLFSQSVQKGFDRMDASNITWIVSEISQSGLPVRLIPFSSVGKDNGMLIGFVPDHAEIHDECGVRVLKKCVIGIYDKQLSKDRSYCALLNPYL